MELLLLAGGAPAAGVPVGVPRCSPTASGPAASASRCAARSAGSVSVNLVTREHVDVPFHNDREIGVVAHLFAADAERRRSRSSAPSSYSAGFDARRLTLQ